MKQVTIILAVFGLAAGARLDHLDNRYLPPRDQTAPNAKSSDVQRSHQGPVHQGPVRQGPAHQQPVHQGPARQGPVHLGPAHQGPAVPQGAFQPPIPILRYDNNNDGSGNYQFAYETGNGIQAEEQGQLQNAGSEHEGESVRGSYSYQAPDGQQIVVHYSADENGFQPSGSHLPTPPPIPEEIQRSIEQNQAEEAQGIADNGQYRPELHGDQSQQFSQYSGPQQQYLPPN